MIHFIKKLKSPENFVYLSHVKHNNRFNIYNYKFIRFDKNNCPYITFDNINLIIKNDKHLSYLTLIKNNCDEILLEINFNNPFTVNYPMISVIQ